MKKISLLVILVALVAGGIYLYNNLEAIVTRQAEKIASDTVGVPVTIAGMDISLADQTVFVKGITVANPQGYNKPYAVQTEQVAITLNTATPELIDFKDITVSGSVVTVELNENGMNLLDLQELMNSKKTNEPSNTANEQVRVIIEKMVIESSVIEPHISFLDRDIASFTMPAIRFSNLGKGNSNGMSSADAVAEIFTKYFGAAERSARSGLSAVGDIEIPGLNEVEDTLNNAVDGIRGLFSR